MTRQPTGNPPGRPRKPVALARLHGDAVARWDRPYGPVIRSLASRPAGMSPAASELWAALADDLAEAGVLTSVDAPMFAEFCEAFALLSTLRARALAEAEGQLVLAPNTVGALPAYLKILAMVTALATRFGLTPDSRARLVAPEVRGGSDLISG